MADVVKEKENGIPPVIVDADDDNDEGEEDGVVDAPAAGGE